MIPKDRAAGNVIAYWRELEEAVGRGDRLGARFASSWLVFWIEAAEEAGRR